MRIALADDHRIVREGLVWMLSGDPDVEIVAEASSGAELLDLLDSMQVDIVLLDVRMAGMSGLDTLDVIARDHPATRVIMLSMHDEPAYVRRAVELGAAGYLLKSAGRAEVLRALRVVFEGNAYIQGAVAGPLVASISDEAGESLYALEESQRDILRMIADGAETRDIAVRLSLSEATVKRHLRVIFDQLGVKTRAEAVASALRYGLID